MHIKKLCILGGTGFVGSHLVSRLANDGYHLKILTRNRERHKKFLVMPDVEVIQSANLNVATLAAQFSDCQTVVNLIGILNGSEQQFRALHAELPQAVVDACQQAGVTRYLHMSALHADADQGPSIYLRTKGLGEQAAHGSTAQGLQVTSFRPSVIFGPDDDFFNRFAQLLAISPVLPLACPNARFAPVYINDVVNAMITSLSEPATFGQSYELCGPRVYTLKELVQYTGTLCGHKRLVLGLSDKLSRTQAKVFDRLFNWLPFDPPFSFDNYQSMQVDSVCNSNGFAALGIAAHSVESIMPRYFEAQTARGRYRDFRSASRR